MDPQEYESLVRKQMNRLRGRLAGFVESLDLSERDERVLISTLKYHSYEAENAIVDGISPTKH